jgi:hypothetical protein
MTNEVSSWQIRILAPNPRQPCGKFGHTIVRVVPRRDSRVVCVREDTVRIAFVPAEVVLLARAMNRGFPRLRVDVPLMQPGCNEGYVPGDVSRPFLTPLGGRNAPVKIGVEMVQEQEHPVVELTPKPRSRVGSSRGSIDWVPSWTEFRILLAEFERTALPTPNPSNETKPRPHMPGRRTRRRCRKHVRL